MQFISESGQVPVEGTYDVIVVGAGMAGIGAAFSAVRSRCRVLLIEKPVIPGGLATAGFIAYYLPLCDGRWKKVTGGIAEELLHLSVRYGYGSLEAAWKDGTGAGASKRYTTIFSPPEFIYALDELMLSEGIELLFDTVFCRPVMDGNRCSAVVVENKTGRQAYKAKIFIDASGDADFFFRAGAKCVEEKNYLAYWFYRTDLDMMRKAVESGNVKDGCFQTAYLGKVPAYDMHMDENRAASVLVECACGLETDMDYDLFGWAVGEAVGLDVPALAGIGKPTTSQLVKMNSSLATGGQVRMYHIPGITPEAPDLEAAFKGNEHRRYITIERSDLRRIYDMLNYSYNDNVDFVYLGCPH